MRQELGVASVIVHAAAYQHNALFAELEREDRDRTFRVNVDGTFNLLRSVLPAIRESGWGRIVLLTSASYYTPSRAESLHRKPSCTHRPRTRTLVRAWR